jgi:glyoxylase-like metal-dependent hydrolase (beta-lactamase superfamily II)
VSFTTTAGAATGTTGRAPRRTTRRRLLRGWAALAGTALFAPTASRLPGAARRAVASGGGALYAFENDANGFNTKTFFYDTGTAVVAFDAQFTPAGAEEAIAFLRTQTTSPLAYAVISHPNPDKFNGIPAFQAAGARVVASRATVEAMPGVHAYKRAFFVGAGMFTDETYPQLGTVDVVVEGSATLDLGNGRRVDLSELRHPGVSSTQTVSHVPELDALVVGDLVHHKAHAWLEGGIVDGTPTPTLDGWIADLDELLERFGGSDDTVVCGGRGGVAPLATAVTDQIAYLERADEIVAGYVRRLGERKVELLGPKAGDHYAALQAMFERVFPDYALGYMIRYGVYGLVNARL